ncbi:glycosyl hydrolase family 25 [Prosthecobacter fusiformis]|uniref:Glycosyl hydrolase family 25 n=1 Tax=Prosthecobacter fusiformis TaxID=48464 RepID=A0A4V3FIB1_9BACT|nr:GH25 family lysozyme [Prosthecobacter fusiformis]TDU81713.1 glycosyl hydrolase family 25 [Prosthecobacter fusiformis]
MKFLSLLPLAALLVHCTAPQPGGSTGSLPPAATRGLPQIINVSAYDPKERQREGRGYTENDVSALRANGASGLIARAGKGGNLDTKCASFLAAADRTGMLVGVYYRLQNHVDAVAQADQFISRAQALASSRSWNTPSLLLCGDFDANSRLSDILRFMDRVESRTGVVPVAYLENSAHLKILLGNADDATKAKLRRMPYWLALYSHESGAGPQFPAPGSPKGLVNQYRVWSDWTLWQYGGVDWEGGRSRPKVYNHEASRFSPYFGNLDRPVERNVFNGSYTGLQTFWQRHGLPLAR